MITDFFIPKLNHHDVQELWFQQDGVTCHTARATIDLLKDTFGNHLISRFGPVNWPPRSCDLTQFKFPRICVVCFGKSSFGTTTSSEKDRTTKINAAVEKWALLLELLNILVLSVSLQHLLHARDDGDALNSTYCQRIKPVVTTANRQHAMETYRLTSALKIQSSAVSQKGDVDRLKGHRFHTHDSVKATILNWLHDQPSSVFSRRNA
ncbi:uncharacterized protein TNCV_1364631 [Trichonephila clavipes]|nr:uncharacterized protein TNCV_1364631 [Trichonephila clavipes]